MTQRLDFYNANPNAIKALLGLEKRISESSLEKSLVELIRLRASLLAWTEAVTLVSQDHVPDEVWTAVRPYFDDAELVDLTLLISTINTWNRFAISFRKTPA